MRVYRFQHVAHGKGPMCAFGDFPWWQWDNGCPSPDGDPAYYSYCMRLSEKQRKAHFFAWNYLDKLESMWKPGTFEALESSCYELTEWEVTQDFCQLACWQVFFLRSAALRIA